MKKGFAVLTLVMGWCLLSHSAWAADIQLVVGGARVVSVASPLRVAIGNPDVADLKQISKRELLISGKAIGTTTLIVWDQRGKKKISTVRVTAGRAARTMIQVEVQVMEIRESKDLDLGLDWEKIVGPAGMLTLKETTAPINAIGTLERGKLNLLLKLLDKTGKTKILARPKLLTLSGQAASFSSGGEIPVSTVSSTGQVNTEWKKYGVNLDVKPTALDAGGVKVDLRAEVSEADFTKLVGGNPAIKTRWASSVIQVQPETTVVIGGLIQETHSVQHSGVPILSDIPVLGYLFKSSRIIKEESELVIFVTPKLFGR